MKKFILSSFLEFEEKLKDLLFEMSTQIDEFERQLTPFLNRTFDKKMVGEIKCSIEVTDTGYGLGLFVYKDIPQGGGLHEEIFNEVFEDYTESQQEIIFNHFFEFYPYFYDQTDYVSFYEFFRLKEISDDNSAYACELKNEVQYVRMLDTSFFEDNSDDFTININNFSTLEMARFISCGFIPDSVVKEILQNIWNNLDLPCIIKDLEHDIAKYSREMDIMMCDEAKELIDELNIGDRTGTTLYNYIKRKVK